MRTAVAEQYFGRVLMRVYAAFGDAYSVVIWELAGDTISPSSQTSF